MTPKLRQTGLSLIEILVALAIGSLLVLGLVEVFAASRAAYQLSTGLARVQENGRFAMDYLQRDLRMVGHLGCVNDQARFLPENVTPSRPALVSTFLSDTEQFNGTYGAAPHALGFHVGIEGYDAKNQAGVATDTNVSVVLPATPGAVGAATDWLPTMPQSLYNALSAAGPGQALLYSDVVVLRYFSPIGAQVTNNGFVPGATAEISFFGNQGARLLDNGPNSGLYAITDCMNAAVFQATGFSPGSGSTPGTIQVAIGPASGNWNESGLQGNQSFVNGQATIYRAESVAYYVGLNANGNPALYRLRYRLTPNVAPFDSQGIPYVREEMVEGIESLQLRFGQDSYTAANQRPTGNIGSSQIANAVVPVADPITAWRRVGMVQVGLLARSPDPAAAAQRDANLGGTTNLSALGVVFTPPNDTRYRTVYEESIALRNRLFGN